MALAGGRITDYHNDHVLLDSHPAEQPGEQPRIGESGAAAYLIRIAQHVGEVVTMRRQQIRVTSGDVVLSLGRQLNLVSEVRAVEALHLMPASGKPLKLRAALEVKAGET